MEPANEIFAPSTVEVAWARQVITAYDAAPRGVMMVEGRMVDAPVIRQAQRVLERRRGPAVSIEDGERRAAGAGVGAWR